jgi:hypothetical protein
MYFRNNLFRDINANTIYYKFGQSWDCLTGTIPIIAFFLGQKEYFRTKGVANSIPKLLVHRSIHWIEKDPYIPHFHRDVIKYVWYKECQNI